MQLSSVLLVVCFLQWHAGDNVGTGSDYTLFSTVDGIVIYSKKKDRSYVSIEPVEQCRLSRDWIAAVSVAVGHSSSL